MCNVHTKSNNDKADRVKMTRQKNERGGRKEESNDSPEIPDRGVGHQTSPASLRGASGQSHVRSSATNDGQKRAGLYLILFPSTHAGFVCDIVHTDCSNAKCQHSWSSLITFKRLFRPDRQVQVLDAFSTHAGFVRDIIHALFKTKKWQHSQSCFTIFKSLFSEQGENQWKKCSLSFFLFFFSLSFFLFFFL